jgi:hypothetical protein
MPCAYAYDPKRSSLNSTSSQRICPNCKIATTENICWVCHRALTVADAGTMGPRPQVDEYRHKPDDPPLFGEP